MINDHSRICLSSFFLSSWKRLSEFSLCFVQKKVSQSLASSEKKTNFVCKNRRLKFFIHNKTRSLISWQSPVIRIKQRIIIKMLIWKDLHATTYRGKSGIALCINLDFAHLRQNIITNRANIGYDNIIWS